MTRSNASGLCIFPSKAIQMLRDGECTMFGDFDMRTGAQLVGRLQETSWWPLVCLTDVRSKQATHVACVVQHPHLIARNNLTMRLLHLMLLSQEIPVASQGTTGQSNHTEKYYDWVLHATPRNQHERWTGNMRANEGSKFSELHTIEHSSKGIRTEVWDRARDKSGMGFLGHFPKEGAPELGLGPHSISCPQLHAVGSRCGVLSSWQVAPHHLVLVPLEVSLQCCSPCQDMQL